MLSEKRKKYYKQYLNMNPKWEVYELLWRKYNRAIKKEMKLKALIKKLWLIAQPFKNENPKKTKRKK